MFHGYINYEWPFSIAMLNYQRVVVTETGEHGWFRQAAQVWAPRACWKRQCIPPGPLLHTVTPEAMKHHVLKVREHVHSSVNLAELQSMNRSINHINQSINQAVNQAVNQSFNQSINQQYEARKFGEVREVVTTICSVQWACCKGQIRCQKMPPVQLGQ